MPEAYILGGLRSYVGLKGGVYKHVPAEKLGAAVLQEVLKKYQLEAQAIDYIIGGNGVGAGGNITRLMALEAGVHQSVPAFTIDVQCGSGLESIAVAAAKIQTGAADVVIAGGFESSSCQPRRGYNPNHPDYQDDSWYSVAKFMPGIHRETVMLEGAEAAIVQEKVTKAELDAWVLRSHALATKAREEQLLANVIAPVYGATKDEGIRPRMSQKLLDRVPLLLPEGKYLTAANACLINDGAAWLVLVSERYLVEHGLEAQARVVTSTACGGDPMVSPRTAITALQKLLQRTGLQATDITAYELNEAFAVIDVLFAREFPQSLEHYNVFGGALAYGHPYGASGGIITLHLLESFRQFGGHYGAASVAAAGGVGTALLIESLL